MFRYSGKPPSAANHGASFVPLERVAADLAELLPKTPGALAFVAHDSLSEAGGGDFSAAELETLRQKTAPARFHSVVANLAAARRAAAQCAAQHLGTNVSPHDIHLAHRPDGKPELRFPTAEDSAMDSGSGRVGVPPAGSRVPRERSSGDGTGVPEEKLSPAKEVFELREVRSGRMPEPAGGTPTLPGNAPPPVDLSLADGHGLSVAWVAPPPVGVDIEIVEVRDCETWRGLLGDDGYALALKIERETREPFDAAATRVWTLLEAGKKAFSLRRVLPRFTGTAGGDWLAMSVEADGGACRLLSALVKNSEAKGGVFALAVAVGNKVTAEAKRELPAKFQFDTYDLGFQADYSGRARGWRTGSPRCSAMKSSPRPSTRTWS